MQFEENFDYIQIEIEKMNNLEKIGEFAFLCTTYHQNLCKHTNCKNCAFINLLTWMYIENFHQENAVDEIQEFFKSKCCSFYSMIVLLRALDSIKKVNCELKRKFYFTLAAYNTPRLLFDFVVIFLILME